MFFNRIISVVAVFAFCSLQIQRAKADDMETAKVEVEKEILQLKDSEDFHLSIFDFAEELQNTSVSKSITSEVE